MNAFSWSFLVFFILSCQLAFAQEEVNYDESKVSDYTLPKLLETVDGTPIHTINEWKYLRRPEIIRLFTENVYGKAPDQFDSIEFNVVNENKMAIDGEATAKQVDITVTRNGNSITIRLNLFVPNSIEKPVPVTLLINHRGPDSMDITREIKEDFWPAEYILQRGYAAAVFDVGDVADDDPETYTEDVLEKLYPEELGKPYGIMALAAWGWGAMRIMDYFESDPDIDQNRSMIVGHSRGGKAALWTSAQDQRWGITVANESGEGGAALSRRRFGETVQIINNGFPYWFTPNFEKYNEKESELPLDQHMLIACIAPRGVYVTAAEEDLWADPKGMYLSLLHATEVYKDIFGISIPLPRQMPAVNNPTDYTYAGFHIRDGKHNLKLYDWEQFLNFADRHFQINQNE